MTEYYRTQLTSFSKELHSAYSMKIEVEKLMAIEKAIAKLLVYWEKMNKQKARTMEERKHVQAVLCHDISPLCKSSGLGVTGAMIEAFSTSLSAEGSQLKAPQILAELQAIQKVLVTEMGQKLFLQIPPQMEDYYTQRLPIMGKQVLDAFPSAAYDIAEAGKCLALERCTACVFHLMRVMEVGLRNFALSLGLTASKNPNWSGWLAGIQEKLNVSKEIQKDAFFQEASTLLHSCKNSWRNPTMHMEKTYTQEDAQAIFNAVQGFMKHLANRIREEKN